MVKVTVFMKAAGTKQDLSAEIAALFSKYAESLADQGLLVTAAKYCRYVLSVTQMSCVCPTLDY